MICSVVGVTPGGHLSTAQRDRVVTAGSGVSLCKWFANGRQRC